MNKKEAVELFAEREFNNIPLSLVERAYKDGEMFDKIIMPQEPIPEDYDLEDEDEPVFYLDEPVKPTFPKLTSLCTEDNQQAVDDWEDDMLEYNDDMVDYEDDYNKWKTEHEKWEKYQDAHDEWKQETECDYYPMWGTLFEAKNSFTARWIRENPEKVQECGFIILDDFDELNVCLGVAGAGYSFYDAHWQPLYDAMGMHWHSDEKQEVV